MSIGEYLEQFKAAKAKEKSENTVEAYMTDIRQFLEHIRNKDLCFEELVTDDIEVYKEYLLKQKMKPKTVNRKLVSIRRFVDFLNNNAEIKILAEIKTIKIQHQEYLDEVLTKNDFDRLIKAAEKENDKRALAIFWAFYLTGCRVSELLQYKTSDVNSDSITVKGKGSKYRYLFPPDRLRDVLNDYIKVRGTEEPEALFVNLRNREPMDRQSIHNLVKRYAGLAKVKLARAHAHNFRHLFGFRLIEEGLSIDEVADILGHTDINTTRIYTRKTKTELMKAIKGL